MKTLAKLFVALAFVGITFVACDNSEETVYPTITAMGSIVESDGVFEGTFKVACDEGSKLSSVTVARLFGANSQSIAENNGLSIAKTSNHEWVLSITIPTAVNNVRVSQIKIEATVSGSNGGTESEIFNTPKEEEEEPGDDETPLASAANFTFTRVGGNNGTGDLSKFGLAWTSNTRAINANITKDAASKLVMLETSAWTSITTVEALVEAIDNATAIDKYSNVSAEKNQDHDDVLGVINGEEYFMIHVTKSTVTAATAGTTIEITGQYKK